MYKCVKDFTLEPLGYNEVYKPIHKDTNWKYSFQLEPKKYALKRNDMNIIVSEQVLQENFERIDD